MSYAKATVDPETTIRLAPADIVRSGLCIGCGACVAHARSRDVRMEFDRYGQMKPAGPRDWLRRPTADVAHVCPFSPHAAHEDAIAASRFPAAPLRDSRIGRFEAAYVGHAQEGSFRESGSSGGMVSWVAAELLRLGLVDGVAHVVASDDSRDRLFEYRISRTPEAIRRGAKSRYYPVELSAVLAEIRQVPGRYAVVGIPCFIKAVRRSCARDPALSDHIVYTLGLFCGHMKSTRMAESFAWQMGADLGNTVRFDYRVKDPDRPANWYRAEIVEGDGTVRAKDWWHLVDGDWGAGFFQNSACNFCDDVAAETADIAFGDAWVEPYSSDGHGANVVVVRTPALASIVRSGIEAGRLALREVDAQFVAETQAAGFRQRREGLAFRLAWPRRGFRPRKRVEPNWHGLTVRRMAVYLMRHQISAWSHRVFWMARLAHWPGLYVLWARAALYVYHALAYSRGRLGKLADRLGSKGSEGRD